MITKTIPPFHVTGLSRAKGKGKVSFSGSKQAISPGIFDIDMNVHFDPAVDNYPEGTLSIQTDLSDGARATFIASTIEFINSFGKKDPTIYLTGQCRSNLGNVTAMEGCRYWVMVVNHTRNKKATPGIVGFCIHDSNGDRLAYGTSLYGDVDAAAN